MHATTMTEGFDMVLALIKESYTGTGYFHTEFRVMKMKH